MEKTKLARKPRFYIKKFGRRLVLIKHPHITESYVIEKKNLKKFLWDSRKFIYMKTVEENNVIIRRYNARKSKTSSAADKEKLRKIANFKD